MVRTAFGSWRGYRACGIALLLSLAAVLDAQAQALPADVQEIIAGHQKAIAEIQRQADEQIKAKNEQVKAQLEKLQTTYTQAGKLDEAVAVRDLLRNHRFLKELKGEADPGTLSVFRSQVGNVMFFEVTGSNTSGIWGSGVYTHDSHLATAAVHAGVLKLGEKGIVKVTILPPQSSFPSTGQNGVSSSSWSSSSYECYKVEKAKPSDAALSVTVGKVKFHQDVRRDPGNLQGFRDQVGNAFLFEVTGSKATAVYGNDIYTDDSPLSDAAVHAGLVVEGKTATVKVTILGPQESFAAIARNEVTSRSWGPYGGSYKVEAGNSDAKQ